LRDTCITVLDSIELVDGEVKNGERLMSGGWEPIMQDGKIVKDSSVAERLLPTKSGFFFGGTDYDEYYIEDLKDTVKILERALNEIDFKHERLIYSSSW